MPNHTFIIPIADELLMQCATPADAGTIYEAIDSHRTDLRTWLPFVDSLHAVSDEEEFLNSLIETPVEKRNLTFLIKKNNVFCGLIGFVLTDTINHKTEIGYWLLPEYRHQGIMTRAVSALIHWSIEQRQMNRIQIKCAVANTASNAIPLRLGFQLEGVERDGELLSNGYTDINVYSLLSKEIEPTT